MNSGIPHASSLVEKFRDKKILIVGDLMLDRYIYGSVDRISPEAPVPVVRVTSEKNMPGGAANVARNVRSLGARAVLSGVIGADHEGRALLDVLKQAGVSTDGVISVPTVRTTVKTRVLADRQQVVRVDWDTALNLSENEVNLFRGKAKDALRDVSGVVIEDYGVGAVSQDVVTSILDEASRLCVPVALDPKENSDLNASGIAVATPNRREAFALAGVKERAPHTNPLDDGPLLEAADVLMNSWKPRFLVITLGAQGMLLVSNEGAPRHIATVAREVFDVSGAGDTVVAAVILGLSAGANPEDVARLANLAAGVVVGKVGTADCTAEELVRFGAS